MTNVVKSYNNVSEEVENRVFAMLDKFNENRSMKNGNYFIETGRKNAMFTLWNYIKIEGMAPRSHYIRVLGKDFEESVSKAMSLIANSNKALTIEETDNTEYSYDKEVFCFGKYKGQRISEVAQTDINYLIYMKSKREDFNHVSKTMEGNFDNIEAQVEFYFDTITKQNRETSTSEYLGERGEKVTGLELTVEKAIVCTRNEWERYSYQSSMYEEIIATDANGNRVRMRFDAGTANFTREHEDGRDVSMRKKGDKLNVKSAKISATFESLGRKTTALSYVRLA